MIMMEEPVKMFPSISNEQKKMPEYEMSHAELTEQTLEQDKTSRMIEKAKREVILISVVSYMIGCGYVIYKTTGSLGLVAYITCICLSSV